MSDAAKAKPDAPRNDSATGNTQQLIGSTEKNAENTETLFATPLRETFITLCLVEGRQTLGGSIHFAQAANSGWVACIARTETLSDEYRDSFRNSCHPSLRNLIANVAFIKPKAVAQWNRI